MVGIHKECWIKCFIGAVTPVGPEQMMDWNYLRRSQMPCKQGGLVCIHVPTDAIDAEHCYMRCSGFEPAQPDIIFRVAAVVDLQLSNLK